LGRFRGRDVRRSGGRGLGPGFVHAGRRRSPSVGIGGDPGEEYVPDGSAFARIGEPDGVNLRSEPGSAGEVVGTLRFDATVALRIDVLDTVYAEGTRWWPVAADGVDGWVSGAYLARPRPPQPNQLPRAIRPRWRSPTISGRTRTRPRTRPSR
jgi:hypothetical protein